MNNEKIETSFDSIATLATLKLRLEALKNEISNFKLTEDDEALLIKFGKVEVNVYIDQKFVRCIAYNESGDIKCVPAPPSKSEVIERLK